MGTKVEGKSYLPGYFAMGDHKGATSSSWYEEKTLTGHLYDGFMLRPTLGYLEYDKEMLKRTMLEHEAIFRKQVYELHRLYRTQKDLMEEFQKKELHGYSLPADTSQSNSFSSKMPSEGTKRIWQMQHMNNAYEMGQMAPTMNSDDRRPSNIIKEDTLHLSQNVTPLEDSVQRFTKKTFDLRLPADEYIDNDGAENLLKRNIAESSFKPVVLLSGICSTSPGNHVSLTLGTGVGPSCRGNQISDSQAQDNSNGYKIVDLNEPATEILCEESADSLSRDVHAVKTSSMQNQGHHSATWSVRNYLGLQRNFFKDRHTDEGTSSNFLDANEELGLNRSFLKKENGKCTGSMNFITTDGRTSELRILPEPVDVNSQRTQSILSSDHKNSMAWFGQKQTDGVETSGRNYFASSQNALHPVSTSFSILQMDHSNTTPPSVSSSAKPGNSISHIPAAVQAPCFNKSTMIFNSRSSNKEIEDTGSAAQKGKKNENFTSCTRSACEAPFFPNGFLHGFSLDSVSAPHLHHSSMISADLNQISNGTPSYGNLGGQCFKGLNNTDVKCPKDVNLNQALLAGFQDRLTMARDKCEEPSVGRWLGKRPARDESVNLESSHGHRRISSYNAVAQESESRQEKVLGLSFCNIQGFTSTFQGKESKLQRTEASEDSSTRILGFPVSNKTHKSAIYSSILKEEQSLIFSNRLIQKDHFCHTDAAYDMHVTSLDKQIHIGDLPTERAAGKISTTLRNHIDLNDVVPCLDYPKSSEISPEIQVVVPVLISEQSGCTKSASLIDLEAPICHAEDDSIFQQEFILSGKQDISQEKELSDDVFALKAAKNIVAMSKDIEFCLDRITCNPFPPPQCDTLQWFAEVVTSNKEHCEIPKEGGDDLVSEPSNDDESDSFEAMTLKLEETKVEEYWSRPKTPESKNEEDLGAASLLLGRPRRGQARRRRQRRDFQKDILPGLASLSRHEVTEDIQTIGGLMKASGRSWQTSVTRRGGRNGAQSTRKKQPRGLAVAVVEIPFSSAPVQTTKTDINADGSSMIGWGRTTRRCRRQRCPPGNIPAPLT